MTKFAWLIWAHFIGDFAFQTEYIAANKKSWYICIVHSVIWTGCVVMALEYCKINAPWKWPFLCIVHCLVDKARVDAPKSLDNPLWFYVDQLIHFIQLEIVWAVK